MSRKKKYQQSFKRPAPSISPKKTGFDVLNKNFEKPFKNFKSNMNEIRALFNEESEDSHIRRYAIVLICGAMDKYMHDLVRMMILEIFAGNAKPGRNFNDFLIPIDLLNRFDKSNFDYAQKEKILNEAVYDMICGHTMQKSNAIDRNMYYIIDFNIWKAIQPRISSRFAEFSSITALKSFIDELANRRNIIAHELDYKPASVEKNDISYEYVRKSMDVVEWLIQAINYQVLNSTVDFTIKKIEEE